MTKASSDDVISLRWSLLCAYMLIGSLICGCDENSYYDHVPAVGMGCLVLDNNSGDDIEVFLDGVEVFRLDGGDEEIQDLEPGVYRIVLSADYTGRSYSSDVDILKGHLTILDVRPNSSTSYYYYDVITTYD
ncbi:MAG: hypothetical protein A2283_06255 [Lentisphaerae bacterium RIFOXYA12_FULL_48_11]|nr:MAG: hypothetical protein A2283_06255 [Lentisphaerae bacterium RIFOXYA12_FULL_48_11]